MTCEGCGKAYTRRQGDVEKAKRQGFARTFCTKACFLSTESAAHAAVRPPFQVPQEGASPSLLITESTESTSSGRRRYYGPEVTAQSDGVNRLRACIVCGTVRKSRSATCRPCYQAARASTWMTVPCSQCSTEFQLMRAEDEKKRRAGQVARLCSSKCSAAWLSVQNARVVCPQCNVTFGGGKGRKYCTPKCRKAAQRPLKVKNCPHCRDAFIYSSKRRRYCSRACADAAHSLRMIGTGNSRYKDGTSYAEGFRRMRPLILERDRIQCRVCGRGDFLIPIARGRSRSGLLIHHLNEDPADNRPENLITLCQPCHGIHHKSATTPFTWFADYTVSATASMTSRWKATTTSLLTRFSSTIA
jgi:5-methylcytosine-specific restriction endonuclease McrA